MTVYRSEQERIDEETGQWWLLDEIMDSISLARQTAPEVLEALITAMAKVIVRAGLGSDAVEMWKGRLDSTTDFQRGILEDEREAQRHENALKMQNYKAWLANGGSYR